MPSSLSKIIYFVIGLLIVGGLVWLVSTRLFAPANSPSTSTSNQNSYSNSSFNNSQSVTAATSSSATQTQTQAPVDIAAAYAQLFQSLSAQPAAFVTVNATSTGDAAALYAMYASDEQMAKQYDSNPAHITIEVALVDITGDGTPEALVYENLPGFCGSAGCALDIYQKEKGKWVKISSLSASDDEIGLSNVLLNGYLNLFITVPSAVGSEPNVMQYQWDGSTYKAKQAVAIWYGGQFVLFK